MLLRSAAVPEHRAHRVHLRMTGAAIASGTMHLFQHGDARAQAQSRTAEFLRDQNAEEALLRQRADEFGGIGAFAVQRTPIFAGESARRACSTEFANFRERFRRPARSRCHSFGSGWTSLPDRPDVIGQIIPMYKALPRPEMKVSEAAKTRRSIRAFLDKPVSLEISCAMCWDIRRARALGAAMCSPGGFMRYDRANRWPASGRKCAQRLATNPSPDHARISRLSAASLGAASHLALPRGRADVWARRNSPRGQAPARLRWFSHNYDFFGAPVAAVFCFIDKRLGPPQWSDLGMYLQTVMLLLREHGLDSCPQECWSMYNAVVRSFTNAPEEMMLFCGMAIGYADANAAVNAKLENRTPARSLNEFATFMGFKNYTSEASVTPKEGLAQRTRRLRRGRRVTDKRICRV